jgi:16S rRNA (cytidine1402-2'-O)-methyltransferase
MVNGESAALISDAGTPLFSDPGFRLIRLAVAKQVTVVPIPGPNAMAAAVSAAGLPCDAIFFGGFLPPKETARRKRLEELRQIPATLVFYEAPHRILELVHDLVAVYGPTTELALGREITKLHEEFLRGSAAEVAADLQQKETIRGEFTVLVGPRPAPMVVLSLEEEVKAKIAEGLDEKEAIKAVAKSRGLGKREVYARFKQIAD